MAIGQAAASWPLCAWSPRAATNSSIRRDLPTPATPRTVNRWHTRSSHHLPERLVEQPKRPAPPDERRVHRSFVGLPTPRFGSRDESPGGHRLGLALERQGFDFLGLDRSADQGEGVGAEQDLPGRGGALQPGGHVHGVPGHDPLAAGPVTGHHLAGVDPHAPFDGGAPLRQHRLVQASQALADLECRPAGPHGIVLVNHGDAEHRHDRVADELLDDPAMELDDLAHHVEVPRHEGPHRLRDRDVRRGRWTRSRRRTGR